MNASKETRLDSLKTASKKVFHKVAEATGEFIRNKIADKTVTPKLVFDETRSTKRIKTSIIKMEHHKMPKISNDSTVSKLVTRKWINVNGLSGSKYSVSKNIKFKTSVLRSDLCDSSDLYIVVKGKITVKTTDIANRRNKKVTFKNSAPVRSCI